MRTPLPDPTPPESAGPLQELPRAVGGGSVPIERCWLITTGPAGQIEPPEEA